MTISMEMKYLLRSHFFLLDCCLLVSHIIQFNTMSAKVLSHFFSLTRAKLMFLQRLVVISQSDIHLYFLQLLLESWWFLHEFETTNAKNNFLNHEEKASKVVSKEMTKADSQVRDDPYWRKNLGSYIKCMYNLWFSISAIEWENSFTSRVVSVRLGPGTFIRVLTNGNQVSRIINVKHMNWITAVRQNDKEQNTLSLRVQREYDLVNMVLLMFSKFVLTQIN